MRVLSVGLRTGRSNPWQRDCIERSSGMMNLAADGQDLSGPTVYDLYASTRRVIGDKALDTNNGPGWQLWAVL
jgi:hypothetical protein